MYFRNTHTREEICIFFVSLFRYAFIFLDQAEVLYTPKVRPDRGAPSHDLQIMTVHFISLRRML